MMLGLLLSVWPLQRSVSAQTFPSESAIRRFAGSVLPRGDSVGMVIGLLAADGSRRVMSAGPMRYDGSTIFEIGSVTNVFTGLLLAEMVERGAVRLDQPM